MDRLSSYASRESETEPQEDRQQNEQEAVVKLLEDLRISKEEKQKSLEKKQASAKQPNGEQANGDNEEGDSKNTADVQPKEDKETDSTATNGNSSPPKKNRGIPDNIKLYEIFYGQVTKLINAQRLQIQDTMALLVSLANLAL